MTNEVIEILIDLSNVDPELKPEELENLTVNFSEEISELVEESQLLRESEIPDLGKPGLGAFVAAIQATVSAANISKLVGTVRERFGAKPVKLVGKKDGYEFTIEVGRPEDLDRAVDAFLKLANGI